MLLFVCIFFFSSRRRHTRWPRDWSSDVCSSDLLRRARLGPARKSRSPHVSILSSLTYQVELTRIYGLASCANWWYEDVRHETMAPPRYLAQVLLYCCTACYKTATTSPTGSAVEGVGEGTKKWIVSREKPISPPSIVECSARVWALRRAPSTVGL